MRPDRFLKTCQVFSFKETYMNIIYILLAMTVWGFVHSLTASLALKEKAAQIFGGRFMRLYRLLYNGFALLTFLPVMALVATLPGKILYAVPAPWNYVMGAMQGAAAFMLLVAVFQTDALHFAGLKQLFEEDAKDQLVVSGLYKFVRHPIYTFSLLFLWLAPSMSDNSLVFYIGVTLYFIIGAYFEERKLLREFGEDYAAYKKSTPMLIPFLL
ncbi:MAG: isoprenylcysteine carboxylmethyltransferase family protein [Anaerolineales bacterium]|nr:isoprenylcysteine carboxylmethyltransferase family protein [Anaerolineales bacterium]